MNLIVRKATLKDISAIKKIDDFGKQLNSYSGLDKLDPKQKRKNKKEKKDGYYYLRYINKRDKWCLVTEDIPKHKIVGFILFNIEKREDYFLIKKVGYLDLVIVTKEARGKGIARMLVDAAREILRKRDITHLRLSVHVENATAREVWKRLGFKEYRLHMWRKL